VPQEPTIAEFDLLSSPVQAVADAYSDPAAKEAPSVEAAHDWEEMLSVEAPAEAAAPPASTPQPTAEVEVVSDGTADEIAEEARFYITAGMNAEAQSAISRLQNLAPQHRLLPELKAAVAISIAAETQESVADAVEQQGTPAVGFEIAPAEIEIAHQSAKTEELDIASASVTPVETEIAKLEPAAAAPPPAKKKTAPRPSPAKTEESDFVLDLDTAPQKPAAKPPTHASPKPAVSKPVPVAPPPVVIPPSQPARTSAAASASAHASASADPLADLVMDVDEALGALNLPSGASSSGVSAPKMAANVPQKGPISAQMSAQSTTQRPSESIQSQGFEAHSMLSDLLDEFKEEIDGPSDDGEDPETHYNLGVAFREMGLLDEAIGELQKVCRAIDTGKSFSQSMQTYTWLAQCLVDKGAPQAAIRWYEKALGVNGINEDSRLAVHYEMATAFEAAGDRKAALENFMQVYGSNIDYRDVADRIRGLRQ
jgi:tetratricopeptide (TPR) repeat protein